MTGMSGAGKSSALQALQQRGHDVVDTDYDGWTIDGRLWDEDRRTDLLEAPRERTLYVSGTAEHHEPLLRATSTHELDTTVPLEQVVDELERIGSA